MVTTACLESANAKFHALRESATRLPASQCIGSMNWPGTNLLLQLRLPRRWLILAVFILQGPLTSAGEPTVEILSLPPLRIHGQPARAHAQGLNLIDEDYYVTARRDDVQPRRALLLRTAPGRKDWDIWDITPVEGKDPAPAMDHPGGFQSDGERLWIPLAESRRNGFSMIRVFVLADLIPGQPLQSEFEFPVNDHIGALAVDLERGRVLGASWDTETVYVWDLKGRLQQTMTGTDLNGRGLGVSTARNAPPGLAVQDWKCVGPRLIASGLLKGLTSAPTSSKSRLMVFDGFFEETFQKQVIILPSPTGIEIANEGMDVSDGAVYFLPEDLGATNRMFRVRLGDLFTGK